MSRITSQNYPRIQDESTKYSGFIDEAQLKEHSKKPSIEELESIIRKAITSANKKSSRAVLNIPDEISDEDLIRFYKKEGKRLFVYFQKYCGDPAHTAYDCLGRHYKQIAKEQIRNRTIQKERMNSGWRYQFIAKDTALITDRFDSVSDVGTSEADFNAVIEQKSNSSKVNIYVSVKNRTNTMGGQDWPKAINAIENMARSDKNRTGPYICVFGIAMEKGYRNIKNEAKTKQPYSMNTEIWMSDFFWPFFTNYTYEEILKAVLSVLIEKNEDSSLDFEVPDGLLVSFGNECKTKGLLDENEKFNDSNRLVELFCGKL